ncbi:sensor histidine kinase [Falsirhodobacter xinxiangensis]|uniref:sensor histidine kinase n=1 Tax=Falsirhodobacter xinxiangensis TaxID=2530049 RepID=UPI0010AB0C07|nr:sensor histidine kinase [Rhodobacter xinxiangensis]
MNELKARINRMTETLGFRLAFLLAVALLPLGMVSAIQSAATLKEARARSEAALMGETMRAAEAELRLVQRARGAASTLASLVVPLIGYPLDCSATMRAMARDSQVYTFVGFVPVSGVMTCSSTGETHDLHGSERLQRLIENPRPMILLSDEGSISGQAVVNVSNPVYVGGDLAGFVTISLPHSALTAEPQTTSSSATPPALITYNAEGDILTSSVGLDGSEDVLPANRSLKALMSEQDLAFTAQSNGGRVRVYSVIPIIPDLLYALGSWAVDDDSVWYMRVLPSLMLPAAMWGACLLVAFLAVERLVTTHVRSLRSAMTGFAGGKREVVRMDMNTAPIEIRELSDTFQQMTDTILHDEAEMEDMIHQKEVLLREVHHRVKNNLQLIASIMNMQMRQARSAEAKVLMKGLQERVMSLATIHRGLYQTTGLTDIRADELLTDITRQVVRLATGPGRRIEVRQDFGDLRLTPDQAVPLALLLTEALANSMKYAGARDGAPRLSVSLHRTGSATAMLEVANSTGERPAAASGIDVGTGLGAQLLSAFAQQLGGKLHTEETADSYVLRVEFEVRPLTEGEARISGGAQEG